MVQLKPRNRMLLGSMGLPNHSTMESSMFTAIEERTAPAIHDPFVPENLTSEVKQSVTVEASVQRQQSLDPNNAFVVDKQNSPKIKACFDTGWNQPGSLHNSPSGRLLMVTWLACEGEVKSELCSTCSD